MFRMVLTLSICLVSLVALAEEISPKVKRIIQLGEIRRKERIAELEGGLKAMKAQFEALKTSTHVEEQAQMDKTTARKKSPAEIRAAKEKEIDNLKDRAAAALQEIEFIKRQKYYCPNMTLKKMSEGDVGILVDPYGAKLTAKITQIVDDETLIVSVDSQPICLTVDTSGLKVGKKFLMTMPFEVTGTMKYKSPGGGAAKEIFVLEQFFFPTDDSTPKQAMRNDSESSR